MIKSDGASLVIRGLWALLFLVLIATGTATIVITGNSLNEAEDKNTQLVAELEDSRAATDALAKALEVRDEDILTCAAQSSLYRFAVEGLAAKVITMLESGTLPDIQPEVDAKQEADKITCE